MDDEIHILSALKRVLRKTSWKVLVAENGEQGLARLAQEPVQVVISDYSMPGMDGVSFLKRVKQSYPDIQRVMLTGHANFDAVERAINESEVFRFLNKPWRGSQLLATIEDCFRQYELIESNRRYRADLKDRNQELFKLNTQLEELVKERTAALLQSEKMGALGRMAGGVAHEINNPLGGILSFTQVLQRDGTQDPQATNEALETIESCALRCKSIVDRLLSFSRKTPLDVIVEVDLNQVAQDSLTLARMHPKAKQLEVGLDLAADLPVIQGQSNLLEQVLVNLLQNAFDASETGQSVSLRTRHGDDNVTVEVEDHGTGIDAGIVSQIFDPFFTTKETGAGTGLGLSLCYGIVNDHGGSLSVESKEGRGATFFIRLPLARNRPREES